MNVHYKDYLRQWRLRLSFLRVVESVVAHGQSDTFLFFLVRFVIADYFAVSDLSVFRDVGEFDEETCVGSRNVSIALE